jgi:rubredoxin
MQKKYKCEVCGYIHDGDEAPANCPKCNAPAEKFTAIDDAAAELIERSRRTNMYHARLVALAREIEGICKGGIDDALDPGCVSVFNKSLQGAYDMMKLSMTEMQGHMNKGKWG